MNCAKLLQIINNSSVADTQFHHLVSPNYSPQFSEFFQKVDSELKDYFPVANGKRVKVTVQHGNKSKQEESAVQDEKKPEEYLTKKTRQTISYRRLVKLVPGLLELQEIGEGRFGELFLNKIVRTLESGCTFDSEFSRHVDKASLRKIADLSKLTIPYLPIQGEETLYTLIVSFEWDWFQGLLLILANLDLYLLYTFLTIFPHCWNFVRSVIKSFIFDHKGTEDWSVSLEGQFLSIIDIIQPSWTAVKVDFDELKFKFKDPVHIKFESVFAKLIQTGDFDWKRSLALCRLQKASKFDKQNKLQPCHWIHEGCDISVHTLREWGKRFWNPGTEKQRTNQRAVSLYRKNLFEISSKQARVLCAPLDDPNPFNPKPKDHKRKVREYHKKRKRKLLREEGRFS